jgi:hypothetical protein
MLREQNRSNFVQLSVGERVRDRYFAPTRWCHIKKWIEFGCGRCDFYQCFDGA